MMDNVAEQARERIAHQVRLAMQDEMIAPEEFRVQKRCRRALEAADAILALSTPLRNEAIEEALRRTLREHWLTDVGCDQEASTNTAHCFCGTWAGSATTSPVAAANEWIEHLLAALKSTQSDNRGGDEAAARIEKLEASVRKAITWFDEYALMHRAKATGEGNDKGQRNQDRADQLRADLADKHLQP